MRMCTWMLTALAFGLSPAAAQDVSRTNNAEEPGESTQGSRAVERAELGLRLLAYGWAEQDPLALLVATRLLSDLPPSSENEVGIAALEKSAILDEVERLAGDDAGMLEQVAKLRAAESRGTCGCMVRLTSYIPPQTTWNVDFNARGGEPFMIAARRDSPAPVGMKIYDENGYLVCRDTTGDVIMTCRFDPAWTGPFRAEIENYGTVGTDVILVTNQ